MQMHLSRFLREKWHLPVCMTHVKKAKVTAVFKMHQFSTALYHTWVRQTCFCLFVTEATRLCVKTGSEQGSYANPLCQITAVTAESFAAPVLDVFLTPLHGLKSQHVMRDTALEFGPPSGTGKLIPLLLDAGTSSCTRLPPPTDGIFPHLAHSHTCVTAQVWPMS